MTARNTETDIKQQASAFAAAHRERALTILGGVLSRLVRADAWAAVVFGSGDELVLALSSDGSTPDAASIGVEIKRARFAGVPLPHVATASDARGVAAMFGTFGGRFVALRLIRAATTKPFGERDVASAESFLQRHADDIFMSISVDGERLTRAAHDRANPMLFLVDEAGDVTGVLDEPAVPDSLRSHLMPRSNMVAPAVRPVVDELLGRWKTGGSAQPLNADLPFGLVRLLPLQESARRAREFVVSVELLRSRVSLGDASRRYSISRRELQVLGGMLRGAPVTDIANDLSISPSTVVFHLKRMLKKTASRNRTELAARMLGWEPPAQ